MNFKTNHITDQFKRTYIRTDSRTEFKRAQELMFKLGFKWTYSTDEKREVRDYSSKWLLVDKNCRILHHSGQRITTFTDTQPHREITLFDLRQAVEAYTAIRKAKKKDQRKRASLRKAGWITHDPSQHTRSPVVDPEAIVEVVRRDGHEMRWVNRHYTWGTISNWPHLEIVRYRVMKPTTDVVSVADMVADIVETAGGKEVPASVVDKDGFISWGGEGYMVDDSTYKPGGMHGPVKEGTKVDVKLRSGEVHKCQTAGVGGKASGWYWVNEGIDNDIVAYRLCPVVTAPAVDKDGFITWTGGVCPVPADAKVDIRFSDGFFSKNNTASDLYWNWKRGGEGGDIVAYRIASLKVGSLAYVGSEPGITVTGSISSDAIKPFSVDATGNVSTAPVGDVDSDARGSGARYNAGKPDYSLIPITLLEGEARVWAYGARKYKAWNWMKGMAWSVPFACAMRHMAAFQRGEDIDPETGESHLDHAMCNLRMLRYYADFYKEGDDRPKDFFVKPE